MRFLFSFTFFLCFSIGISQSPDKYWVQFEEKPGTEFIGFPSRTIPKPCRIRKENEAINSYRQL